MTDLQVRTEKGQPQAPTKTNRMWKPVAGAVALFLVAVTVVATNAIGTDAPTGRSDAAIQAETDRLDGLADKFAQTKVRDAESQRLEALAAWVLQQQAEATAERSNADNDLEARLSTRHSALAGADEALMRPPDRYPVQEETEQVSGADQVLKSIQDRYPVPEPSNDVFGPFGPDQPGNGGVQP